MRDNQLQVRTIDMTRRGWGHNISLIHWDRSDVNEEQQLFIWLTPRPKVGDLLLLQGERGTIRMSIVQVKWLFEPRDMYKIWVVDELRTDSMIGGITHLAIRVFMNSTPEIREEWRVISRRSKWIRNGRLRRWFLYKYAVWKGWI